MLSAAVVISALGVKIEQIWFYNVVMHLKHADEMANSVDPDLTALKSLCSGLCIPTL